MSSTIRNVVALFAAAATSGPLAAQLPPQPSAPLRDAYFSWSAGRYMEAIEGYLRVLTAAGDPDLIEEIAVLTGELYDVHELTDDGLDVTVAPDGRYLAYSVETSGGTETHVVRVDLEGVGPTEVAVLPGGRYRLGPGGLVAYRGAGDQDRLAGPLAAMETARVRQNTLEFRAAEAEVRWLEASTSLLVRNLVTADEHVIESGGRLVVDWVFQGDGSLLVAAAGPERGATTDLYRVPRGTVEWTPLAAPSGYKNDLVAPAGGRHIVFSVPATDPAPQAPGAVRQETPGAAGIGVFDVQAGLGRIFAGEDPTVSADGSVLAWVRRPQGFVRDRLRYPHGPGGELVALPLFGEDEPRVIFDTDRPLGPPAVSQDGATIAYAHMPSDDWEVFLVAVNGGGSWRQVTNEIQHDQFPAFLSRGTVLAAKGEGRHRRSYLYDITSGRALQLFHNNTVRTIAPEYEWAISPTADWIVIVAERDGDTVSPERGVYLVDLTSKVTKEALVSRLEAGLASERALRQVAESVFGTIADSVRAVTEAVSTPHIYEHARSLHSFGSKHVTQPGNRAAGEYIAERLRDFGYDPQLQYFDVRGVNTANVIATLPGHTDPAVTYVISSHYDSHQRGPGADDNTSGTTALLEVARVLKDHPQRATIQFAFFTGEEAGLLGSRYYVGELQSQGVYLAGALNNDMVGWANDHRLDNTIRYSNDGIRDIQHAAAMTFSRLITYDARYYKSTDAHAFYEAYGDIVGGIGSYPVLGNPNYHQATDRLATINHDLVAEVARTTAATIIALASLPSRPRGLVSQAGADGRTRVRWDMLPERDAVRYRVRYRATSTDAWREEVTTDTRVELPGLPDGADVHVKGVSRDGLEGWDWARIVIGAVPSGGG